jgi:nicotinamide mononucleotide transporter
MSLLDPLNATALTVWGTPTTWGEVLGFLTGALCVWLVARQHVANWPIGIANNLVFFALFLHNGLFADGWLQIVYLVLGGYGWWAWLRGGERHTTLVVSRTTAPQWRALAVVGVVATAGMTVLLATATSSTVPLADSVTTVLSLLATWGQARKKVESWWLWIAADLVYVPLYLYKDLVLTAILYVGFLALCAMGLRNWLGEVRRVAVVA